MATPIQKGVRGGFNQLGAMTSAFMATLGDAMGLSQFAAERMKDAEHQAAFAEAVLPEVKDYRQVKDGADAAEFFTGLVGQSLATTGPALAGAAAGRFGGGVRGAYAGGFAGSFVPNSGEQALRLRNEPMAPGDRLRNVVGTGGAAAAMDALLPAAAVSRVARPVRGAGLGGTTLKGAGVEGATEGAQEALGQAMHTSVNPARDRGEDDPAVLNAMIGGAAGGASIGAGTRIAEAGSGLVQDGLAKVGEASKAAREKLR
ncbi:MAG TPA: hypothetical protein VD931_22705, partial [Baekduia sp.]|nr:hypothetical protein [Baekduia sp.]